jgi:FkbM family methyltransferase
MIYPNDETSRCLYTEGYYEPNQICFLRSVLRPGMTFLDIGAHSGVYSLVAALSVGPEGRILSVEPSRREFQKLRLNLQLNKFTAVDVTQAAVSDRNGEMTLKIAGEPHTGHNTAGSFSYPGIALVAEETVKCLTIDELVLKKNLERVDVIKLDIEGSEFAALTGAASTLEKYRPVVLFENPDKPGCGQEPLCGKIWDLLTSKGYRLFRYGRETGLPEPCASYPGTGYSDFIALPSAASRE